MKNQDFKGKDQIFLIYLLVHRIFKSNDSNPYPLLENGMKDHVLLMVNK